MISYNVQTIQATLRLTGSHFRRNLTPAVQSVRIRRMPLLRGTGEEVSHKTAPVLKAQGMTNPARGERRTYVLY